MDRREAEALRLYREEPTPEVFADWWAMWARSRAITVPIETPLAPWVIDWCVREDTLPKLVRENLHKTDNVLVSQPAHIGSWEQRRGSSGKLVLHFEVETMTGVVLPHRIILDDGAKGPNARAVNRLRYLLMLRGVQSYTPEFQRALNTFDQWAGQVFRHDDYRPCLFVKAVRKQMRDGYEYLGMEFSREEVDDNRHRYPPNWPEQLKEHKAWPTIPQAT